MITLSTPPPSGDIWNTIAQLNDLAQASPDRTAWTWTAETTRRDLEADLISLQPAWNRLLSMMPVPNFVTMAEHSNIEREHTRIHLAWSGVPTPGSSPPPRWPNRWLDDPLRPFPVYTWRMTWVFHPTSQVLLGCFVSCQDPSGHHHLIWDEPDRMQRDPSTTTLPCQATMVWTDEALEDCLITRPHYAPERLSHLILPLFSFMLATRYLWNTPEHRRRWARHLRRGHWRQQWHKVRITRPFVLYMLAAIVLNFSFFRGLAAIHALPWVWLGGVTSSISLIGLLRQHRHRSS